MLNLNKYFCSFDPDSGRLFSSDVIRLGIFELGWLTNAEEIEQSILPYCGAGLLFLDVANLGRDDLDTAGAKRLYIDAAIDVVALRDILERDSIDGVGLQSYTYSTILVPKNCGWIGWVSHHWDIGVIAFVSAADAIMFDRMLGNIPLLDPIQANAWISQWKSSGAKRCFEEYISQDRLIYKSTT